MPENDDTRLIRDRIRRGLTLEDWRLLQRVFNELSQSRQPGGEPILTMAELARRVRRHKANLPDAIERIEKVFAGLACAGEDRLIDQAMWTITRLGQRVREVAEQLLAILDGGVNELVGIDPMPRRTVTIAAAESVRTYLLPEVIARLTGNLRSRMRMLPLARYMTTAESTTLLLDRLADVVVTWDDAATVPRAVRSCSLGEVHGVQVICHATHNLARKKSRAAAAGEGSVTLEELKGYILAAPNDTLLGGLVDRLSERLGANLERYDVGRFPQAVNHVLITQTVSLFPNWPWVLNRMRRDLNVHSFRLAVQPEENLRLRALWRVADHNAPDVRQLVAAIADTYAGLCVRRGWRVEPSPPGQTPIPDPLPNDWFCYYIGTMSSEGSFLPSWVRGNLGVKNAGSVEIGGMWTTAEHPEEPVPVAVQIMDGQFLRFHLPGTADPRHGSGWLSRCVTVSRGASDESAVLCLVGHFHYVSEEGVPTGSPLILSTRPLEADACEEIVDRGFVAVLPRGR